MAAGFERLRFFARSLFAVIMVVGSGLVLMACEDTEKLAAQNAALGKLGAIWGEVQIAQDNCPQFTVNNLTAMELLRDLSKVGENPLALLARLASKPAWQDAYDKGMDQANKLNERAPGATFCNAMWASYGPAGSAAPNLLKSSASPSP